MPPQYESVKIAEMSGRQELKLKIKQSEELAGPKANFTINVLS